MSERRSSGRPSSDRLALRRRRRRRALLITSATLLLALAIFVLYELNQPAFRISDVQIYGGDDALKGTVLSALQGSYLGVIPRDSIFFYSKSRVRAEILNVHPEYAAVSIFSNGFTALSIRIDTRVPIAKWCGLAPSDTSSGIPFDGEYCYVFDASGLVYAAYTPDMETVNPFSLYVPLAGSTEEPLNATLQNADNLPHVFDFAREVSTLGTNVSSIVIKNGEVNLYLKSGTRITYVLGSEEGAFTALVSAKDTVNLADGSIDYVDLRFDGKIYLKKKAGP